MLPLAIIKDFDVFEAGRLHVGMSCIAHAMNPLVLETVEPALCRRVIPPGSHRSVREPLGSYGSCHPDDGNTLNFQWYSSPGARSANRLSHPRALERPRLNRLII